MSSAAFIATSPADEGLAFIDKNTPVHLSLGFLAGALGIDPHLAILGFVGLKIVGASMSEGTRHALFGRESGQSLGNELADVAAEVVGLYLGEKLHHRAESAEAAHAETVAGLGAYYQPHPYVPVPLQGLGAYYSDPMYVPVR